jgi:hypothetical protein
MAASVSDVAVVALSKYLSDNGDAFDNTYDAVPYIQYLMMKDTLDPDGDLKRVDKQDGGEYIRHQLEVEEGGTVTFYDGLDVITFAPNKTLDETQWNWRHCVATMALLNTDLYKIVNNEKYLANYITTKTRGLKKNFRKTVNTNLLAYTPAANAFDSLPSIIVKDPTAAATVGGIAQATNAFWRNQVAQSAATTWIGVIQEIKRGARKAAYNSQADRPDLCLVGETVYEYIDFWLLNKATMHPTDEHMSGLLGYDVPKLAGMTVMYDTGLPDMFDNSGTYDSIMLLNTDYIKFTCHSRRAFKMGEKENLLGAKGLDGVGY